MGERAECGFRRTPVRHVHAVEMPHLVEQAVDERALGAVHAVEQVVARHDSLHAMTCDQLLERQHIDLAKCAYVGFGRYAVTVKFLVIASHVFHDREHSALLHP